MTQLLQKERERDGASSLKETGETRQPTTVSGPDLVPDSDRHTVRTEKGKKPMEWEGNSKY